MTLIGGLENIIGKEKTQRLINTKIYKFGVDAFAMNTFSLTYMLNEIFVAGMTFEQSLKTRIAAAVGNTITGRPYGQYRDWLFEKFNLTDKSGMLKKGCVDTLAFVTFQIPCYYAFMYFGGADIESMHKGALSLTVISTFAGRPYGLYMDAIRKQCGIRSADFEENSRSI